MSLPEYQKLLSQDRGLDPDVEDQSTSYPPTRVVSGRSIVYTYQPIYPRKGDLQHVVGAIGKDQEETKDLVQEYFPSLAKFPHDRITVKMPVHLPPRNPTPAAPAGSAAQTTPAPNPSNKEDWAALTNHAWTTFGSDPPERLGVFIEDAEGDEGARLWARDLIPCYVILGIIAFFALFLGIVGFFGGFH